MLDLLWDYPVPEKSNPLNVVLDSTGKFSYLLITGAQDL